MAANQTKLDALPRAHFEADVPNIAKHMLKLGIPKKNWVVDPPKMVFPNWCPSKKLFLDHFLEKIIVLTHFKPMNRLGLVPRKKN